MRGIRPSKRHGVNPGMGVCYFCGEDDGTIVLYGKLKDDAEAPRRAVVSMDPCEKCKALMGQGIILIEVSDDSEAEISAAWEQKRPPNPDRTGGFWVVKDEALERLLDEETFKNMKKRRWSFMSQGLAKITGLIEMLPKE